MLLLCTHSIALAILLQSLICTICFGNYLCEFLSALHVSSGRARIVERRLLEWSLATQLPVQKSGQGGPCTCEHLLDENFLTRIVMAEPYFKFEREGAALIHFQAA